MTTTPQKTYTLHLYRPSYSEYLGCGDWENYNSTFETFEFLTREELINRIADFEVSLPKEVWLEECRVIWHESLGADDKDLSIEIEDALSAARGRLRVRQEAKKRAAEEAQRQEEERRRQADLARDRAQYEKLKARFEKE